MVTFDDKKATVQDKKTKETAFICEKRIDGMFYLRGNRQKEDQDNGSSFLATDENAQWQDVTDEVNKKGENVKKIKREKPKKMPIDTAHH
jgi:hypothetical protein